MNFTLDPKKQADFERIVEERYQGDLHAALRRAIDYFLMYEKSNSLRNVADTLSEIQGKLSAIRQMNADLSGKVADIAKANEQRKQSGGK